MLKYLRKLFSKLFSHRSLAFYTVKEEYTGESMPDRLANELVKALKSRKKGGNDPLNGLIQLLEKKIKILRAQDVAKVEYRLNELLYENWHKDEQWVKRYLQDILHMLRTAKKEGYGITVTVY